jgi:hypothetical protein
MTFDLIDAKIKSLQHLSSVYGDNLWKMIGFLLLVLGWLITSESARIYIGNHHAVQYSLIITLILSVGAWVRVCLIVSNDLKNIERSVSSSLDAHLKEKSNTDNNYKYAYSGYIVEDSIVWINIAIVVALGVMVGVAILSAGLSIVTKS